ncbi:MAG: bifunctional 5,10-methylenetetrahydrofolate dehydrogenase/5,10-methenyltetrahydrofolate cyclohydrolase [Candidatus Micrarchaeota archaeon]
MATLLDGKKSSEKWLLESAAEVKKLSGAPCLALVRAGDDPASAIYLAKKKKACEKVGIKSLLFEFAAGTSQKKVVEKIEELNSDISVHAILVQVPLPKQIDPIALQEKIAPLKDVDGFGPYNMGRLFMGKPQICAVTPAGIMRLLADYKLSVRGKKCVVVGRSNIVGKPLALLLLAQDATVSIAHSKTKDLARECRDADFLFVAAGKAGLVRGDMIKPGAVVVDVGVNRCGPSECKSEPEEGDEKPSRGKISGGTPAFGRLSPTSELVGDVDSESAKKVASYITPVPGGVGPMTIASLIANTTIAYKLQNGD